MDYLPIKHFLEGQGYSGNAYALGNCTWYVYNRFAQIGVGIHPYLAMPISGLIVAKRKDMTFQRLLNRVLQLYS